MVSKRNRLEDVIDYGEILIKDGLIEDGKLVDKNGFKYQLERVVKQKKWKRANVSFCVSDGFVSIRHHQVPAGLKEDEVKTFLLREADDKLRLPFKNPRIDFKTIRKSETSNELLVIAYPRDLLEQFIKIMEAISLHPVVADVSSLSIWRMYEHFESDINPEQDTLVVQWGKENLVLAAFEKGLLVFSRNVTAPTENRMWSWSFEVEELQWSGSDQDLQELIDSNLLTIERFIDFYRYSVRNGEKGIEKTVVAGDFPFQDKAIQLLKEQTDMEVKDVKDYFPDFLPAKYSDLAGLVIRGNSK